MLLEWNEKGKNNPGGFHQSNCSSERWHSTLYMILSGTVYVYVYVDRPGMHFLICRAFWSGASANSVVVEADAFKETDVIYRAISSRGHHNDMLRTAELVNIFLPCLLSEKTVVISSVQYTPLANKSKCIMLQHSTLQWFRLSKKPQLYVLIVSILKIWSK